jgi:hypothetical protein
MPEMVMNRLPGATTMVAAFIVLTSALTSRTAAEPPAVSGAFLGDGQDGNLKFLVVENREPFSDQPAIRLVFTEKDPSKSKKPGWDAGFKKLGSALILNVHRDGGIFGCEVAHSAHDKSPFSALGTIKMTEFVVTGTTVSGRVTTGGEDEAFGQKWDVDLTFSAPLPAGAFAEPAPEAITEEPAEPQGPRPSAKEIPIPPSAEAVQVNSVVGQISFKSPQPVPALAQELSEALQARGWKDGKGGLATKANTILVRERNDATITLMIQAAGAGSSVKVITQGLDWSETPGTTPSQAPDAEAKDIEAEANQLLQDALKMIPGRR